MDHPVIVEFNLKSISGVSDTVMLKSFNGFLKATPDPFEQLKKICPGQSSSLQNDISRFDLFEIECSIEETATILPMSLS